MIYYYKDKNGNLYALKSPKWHTLEERPEDQEQDTYSEEELALQEEFTELTEEQFNELKPKPKELTDEEKEKLQAEQDIAELKAELKKYDYIGVKIAMGVSTPADYASEIVHTERIRARIRQLEEILK